MGQVLLPHFAPEIEVSCERKSCYRPWRGGVHGQPFEFILVCRNGHDVFIETPCQYFEVISPAAIKDVSSIPKTSRVLHKMASLKDAKVTIEEGGCTIWGQLPDIPYKSDRFGLGFTAEGRKVVRRARAGRPPLCVSEK